MSHLRTLLALLAGALVFSGLTPLAPAAAALEPDKHVVTTTVTAPGGAPAAVDVAVWRYGRFLMSERFVDGEVRLALPSGQYRLGFYPLGPLLDGQGGEPLVGAPSIAEKTPARTPHTGAAWRPRKDVADVR